MNWRHFFGWIGVVVLLLIELAGVACLWLALHYSNASDDSVSVAAEQPLEAPSTPDTISIIIAGDAMMHMPQLYPARQPDGSFRFEECFRYIAPVIAPYDIRVVNLETTLPGKSYSGFWRSGRIS